MQALSVSVSCLEFGPNDYRVVLKPRHGYVPKVLSTPFRAQVITLLALPAADGKQVPNPFCPVRVLRVYACTIVCSDNQSRSLFASEATLNALIVK